MQRRGDAPDHVVTDEDREHEDREADDQGRDAAGPADFSFSEAMGFIAVALASVNIFGGFIVTQRMLAMFKKKQK